MYILLTEFSPGKRIDRPNGSDDRASQQRTQILTLVAVGPDMLSARQATRVPAFTRQIQTAAAHKSRKFSYQAASFVAACTVAGAAAAHFHIKNSVIYNDTLPKDLPISGEVNLETSRKGRGKELLNSEGWGSNGSLAFYSFISPTTVITNMLLILTVPSCWCLRVPESH